ncbi:LamG-like jellyroll fold domain-containing protein [uncultured Polaribacter sp.]|uniref:LamG-like jellyroll fold domain-containing protein n=1 Tax=uncultured Polaribacter sp. TaxID=174711 RepID=UPI0026052738|nr:LamG-like jellyroll fold domain-containing protein [uncultured Polaribacter sp.]
MNKTFNRVFEFGGIQYSTKNKTKKVITTTLLLFFITFSHISFSQTIAGTGSAINICGNCTPSGWTDTGGTPDISNRTNAGGQGSVGGGASWVNTLPLPPTGDLTWISLRDIGDGTDPNGVEESIRTTMSGLVAGKVYRLNIYTLTTKSNNDGSSPTGSYYAGNYMEEFDYEIEGFGRQPIRKIPQDVWGTKSVIFIGKPSGGNMELSFYPGTDAISGGFPYEGLQTIQIAIELNALKELDSDNDGVPDFDDVDDDNDGILDIDETTSGGIMYDPFGDEDNDKLPNYLDVRDDNLSASPDPDDTSITDYEDLNQDGIPDVYDFDDDGVPNHLDLDSDNDGIPDNIEAQTTNGYIAPSGAVGSGFTDEDGDGLDDNYDPEIIGGTAGTAIFPVNSDSAAITDNPDYLDLDSDEDGVSDTIEGNLVLSRTIGINGLDSTHDSGGNYKDVNGTFDNTQTDNFPDDGNNANLGLPNDVNWRDISIAGFLDTDLDGVPNNIDKDSDNDGIRDYLENCLDYNAIVTSQTGIVDSANLTGVPDENFAQINTNGNIFVLDFGEQYPAGTQYQITWRKKPGQTGTAIPVINESVDNATYTNNPNAPQSNQTANFQTDIITSTSAFRYLQITKANPPSVTDFEVDAIGILDTNNCNNDVDGDGTSNYLDLDSDNDGIPDNIEAQTTINYIAPTTFTDLDNDGLDDNYDGNVVGGTSATYINPTNTDGTDAVDYLDLDSDNDGTPDRLESNSILDGTYGINGLDRNFESLDNYSDVNGTYDNTPFNDFPDNPSGDEIDWRDATSVFSDNDGDGVEDLTDLDDDNDGILDSIELCNASSVTTSKATITINIDLDSFEEETTWTLAPSGGGANIASGGPYNNANDVISVPVEITSTGTYVFTISDSFGDGLNDNSDGDNENGTASYSVFLDGSSVFASGANPVFGSGGSAATVNINVNSLTTTTKPACLTADPSLDSDNDGILNYKDPDYAAANGSTIVNGVVASLDTDADGIPNFLDLDSDNDGIPDNIEAQTTLGYAAPDGVYDANGVDTEYIGGLTPRKTDNDSKPDYLDIDSDDDGILDNSEAGITLSGIYGNNGLDNDYDNGDNYNDVNGSFDNSQSDNFPDADGDVFNAGDVDYRDDTFTTDYDDDGISDEFDLDDDNDGILDDIEIGACTPSGSPIFIWETLYDTNPNSTVIDQGDDPILADNTKKVNNVTVTLSRTTTVASESEYRINDATTTNSSYTLNQGASASAVSRHRLVFSAPVYGVSFTLYDVNQDVATTATDQVQVILTKQDGTTYELATTDYTLGTTNTLIATNTFQGTGATSSNIVINPNNTITEWITQIQIMYENASTGSLTDKQDIAIGDISFCTPLDTDNDGVSDFRDLDADNDGIPDNIEAQSTLGYIAPTGNYSISGIDLAYDTGLTPVNTDGDAVADYLDLDSDNEGDFDIVESGSGLTDLDNNGVADGVPADFGLNGLINSLDDNGVSNADGDGLGEGDGDNYKDVNGTFDSSQNDNFNDADSDVNIGGDLDYRDAVVGVDTDGDGIANTNDIDDDNDGVPDYVENQGCDSPIASFVTSPQAYWTLDNTLNDGINSFDAGSGTATPIFSTDAIQGTHSASFDGNNQEVRYSIDGGFMESSYREISFSAWIKPTSVSGQTIIYEEGGGTHGSILWIDNGILTYSIRKSSNQRNIAHPTSLSVGLWHHVASTYNNGVLTVYLNGVSATFDSGFTDIPSHSGDGGIGGSIANNNSAGINTGNSNYSGLIDAARYSNAIVFSSADIKTEATLTGCDNDGDGVPNSLDIDADNDGIPDNVEAQTTLGYVAPSGADTDNDGLDDAYDTDCAPCAGVTGVNLSSPNNHDTIDTPDYLDTDSDNDGKPDIEENGDSNDVISGIDTDGDGLDDNFEGANKNDGYDVNDEINNPSVNLPDEDSDINTTGDVDYRDDTTGVVTPSTAGNVLWLRADIDVTGTTTVTQWDDQSEGNFIATGASGVAPSKIDNGVNFNPTINFDGTNDRMRILDGILGGTSYTNLWTYFVINPNTATTNGIAYETVSGGNYVTGIFSGDVNQQIGNGNTNHSEVVPNLVGEFGLYTLGSTNTAGSAPSGTNQAISKNGSVLGTQNQAISFNGLDDNFDLGSINNASDFFDGQLAEIIIINETPSQLKQQQIESYLSIKYGITLSNDADGDAIINEVVSGAINEGDYILQDQSTKIWDSESAFHFDVAGIGRDDAMVLNQKQSKSINSDAIITIGLKAIANNNALNTNTFTANKHFLVWGNNNGVINTTTETELICAPEKTIGRTWKVVENGNVGKTQITVDRTIIDNSLTTNNTLKVFKVADDASLTTNVEYIPLIASTILDPSTNVYTVDYNFEGVKYFTYSEVNGIFWQGDIGDFGAWSGGNSIITAGVPSRAVADRDKVMVIDAQTSGKNALLTENVEVECVWVKSGSKLMIPNERYLEFDEDFILDGEVRLQGDGQLLQTHIGLSNVEGVGKLFRDQKAVVPNVYRYHYWTSPVRELSLNTFRVGQVMKDGNTPTSETSPITDINFVSLDQAGIPNRGLNGAAGIAGVTPITIANYWIYTNLNDPAADNEQSANYVRKKEDGAISRARGYTMKSTGESPQNFTFVGTPNDGSISFPITGNTASLVGNPYPSALDATDFINTNIDAIEGTLYFWEHTGEDTEPEGISGHTFAGYYGGYSQRNLTMGIAANGVPTASAFVYDWATAINNTTNVTQTVEGIEAKVTFSNNTIVLDANAASVGGTTANIIAKSDGSTDTYDITVTFDSSVNLNTIFLYNDAPSFPASDPTVTLTPNNSQTVKTQLLSGNSGQEVILNWSDVSTFTITTDRPYNLVIDNIEFTKGGLPSLGDGTYHAPNRYIAVAQGFFVRADTDGGTLRFENSQRNFKNDDYLGNNGTFFFKTEKKKKVNKSLNENEEEIDLLPVLKLGFNRTTSDFVALHRQIGISFRRGNSFGYENGYDSEIFDVGENDLYWQFPELQERKLVIAGVAEITDKLEVPVTIAVGNDDVKSIQIDEIRNITRDVYLLDKLTDTYYTLNKDPLELTIAEGIYTDRFFITFGKKTTLSVDANNPLNKELTVFMDNGLKEIVIQNSNLLQIKEVALFNILGQKINTFKNLDNTPVNRLKVNKLTAGIYIINFETATGKLSKKVVIE